MDFIGIGFRSSSVRDEESLFNRVIQESWIAKFRSVQISSEECMTECFRGIQEIKGPAQLTL